MIELDNDSAKFAQKYIRDAFQVWVKELHSEWSNSTVLKFGSDAYYLFDNDCGVTLAEAISTDDGERCAFIAIERYITETHMQISAPSVLANEYLYSLQMLKKFFMECYPELLRGVPISLDKNIPETVIEVLKKTYANGFRFDSTTIRLLSSKASIEVDLSMQNLLKRVMFRRSDDIYFLPDVICNEEARREIVNITNNWLDNYGCFEVSKLYELAIEKLNNNCISCLVDFEAFFEFIYKHDVRCVEYYRTRIVRINKSFKDLSAGIALQIIELVHNVYAGTVDEDILREHFSAFSAELLANIIKDHAAELVKTEINGIVCYQTLGALGFSDEFADTLAEVLEQIERLGLLPSEEVLHTALSIRLGVNFKSEHNIPDDRTYRRLIETYYKCTPKRKWLKGMFAEVQD